MEEDDNILPQLPLDSSFFNQLHINEESSQTETETSSKKRKRVGGDAAMNNSSTFPVPLPFDSSPNLTPKKRKEGPSLTTSSETPTKRRRGRPPGSGSKNRKERPSRPTSETTSAETPTKKRRRRPSGGRLASHIIELNAGQDVVDVLYNISQANPHKTVTILSASGSVSDIADLTPNGLMHCKGEFEIYFMAIKCVVDDDGRHCREKATFMVGYKDDKGNLLAKTSVNSLIAAGRVKITATLFNTDTAKKTGARISAIATAGARIDDNNPIAATPLQVTGASNDQDMKFPSVGDT